MILLDIAPKACLSPRLCSITSGQTHPPLSNPSTNSPHLNNDRKLRALAAALKPSYQLPSPFDQALFPHRSTRPAKEQRRGRRRPVSGPASPRCRHRVRKRWGGDEEHPSPRSLAPLTPFAPVRPIICSPTQDNLGDIRLTSTRRLKGNEMRQTD